MSKKMMGELMRQAQEMQAKMGQLQEQAGQMEATGTAGGGMVTATANGKQEIISLTIEKDVVDPDDVEMLQDLVMAAVTEAQKNAKQQFDAEVAKLTGGLNIPGMGGGGLPGLF